MLSVVYITDFQQYFNVLIYTYAVNAGNMLYKITHSHKKYLNQ
jgi:hypothetical protein